MRRLDVRNAPACHASRGHVSMNLRFLLRLALVGPIALFAAIIRANPPPESLTAERIAKLPATEQPAWRDYLARSTQLRAADQKALRDEMAAAGLKDSLV